MEDDKLFELYEKLYFHEVESRDKISGRLQIPLAIILTIIGVIANITKGLSFNISSAWGYLFWIVFVLTIVLFIFSVTYFIRSFYGHSYQFLPQASETENYRQTLIKTYEEYKDGDELSRKYFNEYLFKYYNECSSTNTQINDRRSEALHKCNTYLILSTLPLVIAFLLFTLGGIDKNSKDKEYKVKITNSFALQKEISIQKITKKVVIDKSIKKEKIMAKEQPTPPPPPPPPPKRVIKEDVQLPKPKPPKK